MPRKLDIPAIRAEFPILSREVYGKPLVYLDNGASAQKPQVVIDAITHAYAASVGNRMNQVMKTLAILTSIFAPLTFIAGIYGMNFEHMPELKWKYGYPISLSVVSVICVYLYYRFKKSGWL